MYGVEIHEALDNRDLNLVWDLMFKRSAWIQNNQFNEAEISALQRETLSIRDRLHSVQQSIYEGIQRTAMTKNAARAYEEWRPSK